MQGNLDPLALIAGGGSLDRAIDDVLANYAAGRLIFNLGHGILPETPVENVKNLARFVQQYSVTQSGSRKPKAGSPRT